MEEDNEEQLVEQEISSLDDNNSSMIKENAKAMGKQAVKDVANIAKNELKTKVKAIITKYGASVAIIIAKVLLVLLLFLLIVGVIEWIKEKFEAKEAPQMFMQALGIEDADTSKMISEFVQIKKDDEGDGYHFEFVDDFEEKVQKAAEYVGSKYGNLRDPELWKQFLMADFATQLPNLGGSGQVISNSGSSTSSNGRGFWWPIGSSETTEVNGKTFASGEPEIAHGTNVVEGGFSKGWCTTRHFKTTGEAMDIAGNYQIGHYNIISMAKGVVERADDGYSDNANFGDNGGMGNCVYVRYPGDILVRYMHLSKGSVKVKAGDEVEYGQVLGKMGHSGASYQPHLHIDMWIGAENSTGGQDVAAYFDDTNPRPVKVSNEVSNLDGFLFIGDSIVSELAESGKLKGKDLKYKGVKDSTPKTWLDEDLIKDLPENSNSIKGISIMLGTDAVSQDLFETEEMSELLLNLQQKYENKPIYVQKILSQQDNFDNVVAFNEKLLSLCQDMSYNINFIDATKDVELSEDGIHPTSKGYKTLAQNIKEAITSVKDKESTSISLKPVDEQAITDEITADEEDFINQAPKEFQGTIKIKRISPNKEIGSLAQNAGIKTTELKYVDPETFEGYVSSGDAKALTTFTLSEDYSEIITAKWSYNGTITLETNSGMDYRNLTANYAMPYEYPMMFHVTGKDALFSQRLMYLVLGSSVDMVLIDNVTTTETKTETLETTVTNVNSQKASTQSTYISKTTYSYKEDVYTTTELGAVNSWWSKRTTTFNINSRKSSSSDTGPTITTKKDDKIIYTQDRIEETTASYTITSSNTDFESNHEPFVTIYNSSKARYNTQANWLFDFMAENDRTANLVELTKYLLYQATGVDYGVTNFDDINLSSILGMNGYGTGTISPFGISLSKEEFVSGVNNSSCTQVMKNNAAGIYDICKQYNINPAYTFGHACVESGYGTSSICLNKNNYYGMGAYNNNPEGSATYYSSILESTKDYCEWIKRHATPGTSEYEADYERGKEYAIVNPTFIGTPSDNIYVLFSRYAVLDSTHHGGSAFDAKYMYRYALHKEDCGHADGTPTTTLEYSEWSEYTTNERIRIAREVFGDNAFPIVAGAGEVESSGEGYDKLFKSSSGKTYKLYIQNRFAHVPYWGNNIKESGCGPTAAAIISTGFGFNDTPATVAKYNANGYHEGLCRFFRDRGLNPSSEEVNWDKIIQHLKNGNPLIASITSYININGSPYSNHYITFLDIKGDEIFIGDPYDDGWVAGTSWQKISFLQNSGAFGSVIYVSK